MGPVNVWRVWGWTMTVLTVLWVVHRLREGWPAPLSDWWPFYAVSAVLLLVFSVILTWWPVSPLVRMYQEQAHARGQR
jgi:hypothetical protein